MKKNRLVKVLTSAALTAAMVMSMGGMSAFANTQTTLTKTVVTDGNTYAPVTDFRFTISAVAEADIKQVITDVNTDGTAAGTLDYRPGVTGGLVFENNSAEDKISFTKDAALSETGYNGQLTLKTVDDAFKDSKPGIYVYQVKEENDNFDTIKYDPTVYNVYVIVTNKASGTAQTNEIVADQILVVKDGDTKKEDNLSFSNNYDKDEDPDNPHDITRDLTVKKEVTGNQGDRTAKFDFTVSIANSGTTDKRYKILKNGEATTVGADNTAWLEAGKTYTISLGHNDTIQIYGLTANDTYTIQEDNKYTEAANGGYAISYKEQVKVTETSNGSGIANEKGASYTVENNKNVSTPTGIILSFAPYILLVAIAGVFAVSFLRKKREEF